VFYGNPVREQVVDDILLGENAFLLFPRGLVDKGRAVRIQGLGEVGEIGPSVVLRGDGRLAEALAAARALLSISERMPAS